MSKKSLLQFLILVVLLIIFGLGISLLLHRQWKRRLMQYETKGNPQQVEAQEILPVEEADLFFKMSFRSWRNWRKIRIGKETCL